MPAGKRPTGEAMTPFKEFLSPALVRLIAAHLPDPEGFAARVVPGLAEREMAARARWIAAHLLDALPPDPAARHAALRAMLHPEVAGLDRASDARGIAGWGIWPLSLVVGEHGGAAFDDAMETLRQMTLRHTAEFAIRPLIAAEPARAFAILQGWTRDPSAHVRRLASEGARPRLPWGTRLDALVADPAPLLPLLEALKDDPSDYVRRSVANNLNDIAKDHPGLVVAIAGRWLDGASGDRAALVRHALRTLVKRGDPAALALLGLGPARVRCGAPGLDRATVALGDALTVTAEIASEADVEQAVQVDLVLHLLKANGRTAPKVFKGARLVVPGGGSVRFARTHRFRAVTTRRAYPGRHGVALRINGVDTDVAWFDLTV